MYISLPIRTTFPTPANSIVSRFGKLFVLAKFLYPWLSGLFVKNSDNFHSKGAKSNAKVQLFFDICKFSERKIYFFIKKHLCIPK